MADSTYYFIFLNFVDTFSSFSCMCKRQPSLMHCPKELMSASHMQTELMENASPIYLMFPVSLSNSGPEDVKWGLWLVSFGVASLCFSVLWEGKREHNPCKTNTHFVSTSSLKRSEEMFMFQHYLKPCQFTAVMFLRFPELCCSLAVLRSL